MVGQYGKALAELGPAEWPEAQKQLRRGLDLATQLYHGDTANRLAFGHYIYEKQHLGAALAAHRDAGESASCSKPSAKSRTAPAKPVTAKGDICSTSWTRA